MENLVWDFPFKKGTVVKKPKALEWGGKEAVVFQLACRNPYRSPSGRFFENVSFYEVMAFDGLASEALKLKKGDDVKLTGCFKQRKWKDGRKDVVVVPESLSLAVPRKKREAAKGGYERGM